ncbi:putative gustatory receptor 28b [Vespula squamosa]|uniref:Gustatory receptor n=1 Tax=Vespula squamosa TaxID=30214 RepID=A0ABD2AXZ5_VESSQ
MYKIHKIYNSYFQIRDFIFQLVQNRLTFTACGFYDLNHTFIYSIIGSIATYLVILIQLGDKSNVLNVSNTNTSMSTNTLEMSFSTEFRRSIKPLIIINSIFSTGLIEYFVDDKINTIGMFYGFFCIIFYVSVTFLSSFFITYIINSYLSVIYLQRLRQLCSHYFHWDFEKKGKFIHSFNLFNSLRFLSYVILNYFLQEVKRFILQVESCIRIMQQLNIPMNSSNIIHDFHLNSPDNSQLSLVNIIRNESLVNLSFLLSRNLSFFHVVNNRFNCRILDKESKKFVIYHKKMKFNQLNELLKNMLTTTIDSPQHKRVLGIKNNRKNDSPSSDIHRADKSNEDVITIKKAKEIHLELIKCARKINDAYSLYILFSILIVTIFIIITTYNMYYYLLTKSYHTNPLRFFLYLFWILYFAFKIIIISYICAGTVTEVLLILFHISLHAANTGDILCELYEPSTSDEFRAEIHDFTLQLIQNPLSFTTCGFFDLDYTLIRNVIATITTYLVILIQVGNVPPEFITIKKL